MTTRTVGNTTAETAEFLKTLDRVAVTTHVGADGDAIGSSAALIHLMRNLGSEAVFCHAEEVPNYLQWLVPDPRREVPEGFDLLVVDTSREDRAGATNGAPRLNLDHHEDNPNYAEYNLVDATASASAEIVARLFAELEVPIDRPAAEAIYTGIRTDTGGFRFRNVSPEAHELVADLLRAGVVPAEVDDRINRTGTIEQLNIVGVTLANAVRYGEAIIATVDNDDYDRTGGSELDSKEAIDSLRTVAGVDVVAHLREVPDGTKGSLRSERMDVAEIARTFGGGGHRLAAGYTARGKRPAEAREDLLKALSGAVDLGEDR
ncbi:MAG: bifunctional oligoribonuclease/PAP phosphatase NrnA [Rubrobacteraceae bacterium]